MGSVSTYNNDILVISLLRIRFVTSKCQQLTSVEDALAIDRLQVVRGQSDLLLADGRHFLSTSHVSLITSWSRGSRYDQKYS